MRSQPPRDFWLAWFPIDASAPRRHGPPPAARRTSGSAITAITAFRNAVRKFGRSIPEASQLCSANPARLLGLKKKGALAAGMDADVILLDRDLRLAATLVQGKAL